MTDVQYHIANQSDIKDMARYRVIFLSEISGTQTDEQVRKVTRQLEHYFSGALKERSYIGFVAKSKDKIVGMGGMTIRQQPGNFKNPTGRTGYIMNMYTIPEYRGRGICTAILKKLIESGRELDIDAFELHATADGVRLYEKHGFEKHHEPTYRKYGVK